MLKGFADWLVLGEDAVPTNAVGTGDAVAGLHRNPPGPRRRRARTYKKRCLASDGQARHNSAQTEEPLAQDR